MSRRKFTKDFKAQVLELSDLGGNTQELAKQFDITPGQIYQWRRDAKRDPELVRMGESAARNQTEADELRELRAQNARLKLENEVLKKAALILGTSHP